MAEEHEAELFAQTDRAVVWVVRRRGKARVGALGPGYVEALDFVGQYRSAELVPLPVDQVGRELIGETQDRQPGLV